jgi:hypothetical protein
MKMLLKLVMNILRTLILVISILNFFSSTEFQNELKTMNESPLDRWLKSLVYENFYKTDDIELLAIDIFNRFEYWKKQNGYEIS